ncbi:family 16 glycosylhydrolase [Melioribacteraceae bacterium 4301-Me]|uniref:family 16 glycosylhydrolase n=1 Tax=Pyranulibacter aquaticus TaxID=3163344 RepID=UPI00359C0F34
MKAITAIIFLTALLSVCFGKNYKGAEYRTKQSFLYGRFEASIKAPGKEGLLTSLFTYFDGTLSDPWSSSKWNEIDIEILGRYNNDVQFNTITPGQTNHVRHQLVNFNPAEDFHTYAFEWTPDYVAWFIDGDEVYRQTGEHIKTLIHPQKFMMNIWNPAYTNWAGEWNEAVLPAYGYYDWAAYYEYKPGEGDYGTNNNFKFSWRDDFNFFDSTRWQKATHTWDGNNCDFIPDNAVFVNGKLVLCLTNNNETGYNDKTPPSILSARAVGKKIFAFFSEELDSASAVNFSNYIINLPGSKIQNIDLLKDKRTVLFTLDADVTTGSVIVRGGVKDLFGNIINPSSKPIFIPQTFQYPIKVIAGYESAYKDFLKDQEWNYQSQYGYIDGGKSQFNLPIVNASSDEQLVYQTERWGMAKYEFQLEPGIYRIALKFAENYFTEPGKRVFDVYVQGNKVINSLDLVNVAGVRTKYDKVFDNIYIGDNGILDIHFSSVIDNPIINGLVIEQISTKVEHGVVTPKNFKLEQNYPNPFNPTTVISYQLPVSTHVTLKIYDLLGRKIATLVNEEKSSGSYSIKLSTSDYHLSSGIYFYRMTAGKFSETKKMILLQ